VTSRRGFANPEYLIALTFVLVILAVAIPPFMRAREKRRALKDLAAARAALVKEPSALASLPPLGPSPLHPRASHVSRQADDAGGWIYSAEGALRINCTHTDNTGKSWDSY